MGKKRVYEIARERGLQTQQVLLRLRNAGLEVKSASSTVADEDIARVFGATPESVSPAAAEALPSWLNPSAAQAPRTTSRAAIEKQKTDRQEKVDAAKAAKQKAIDQAKRLRAQLAEKKARQEAAAAEAPVEEAAAVEVEEPVVEAPEAPAADASDAVDAPSDVDATPVVEADVEVEAPTVDAPVDPAPRGPRVVSSAQPVAEAVSEPAVDDESDEPSELELRKQAQIRAAQRVAEQAQRRRAQLEAQKLEEQTRAKGKEKAKDRKAKAAEKAEPEEFIGSRKSRVGQAPDGERGGRGRKRRVVIDAQANRRGQGGAGGSGGGKRGRKGDRAKVEIDPTVPVTVPAGVTVKELAEALVVGANEIIKILFSLGDLVTITQSLSDEQVELIGESLEPQRTIEIKSLAEEEEAVPTFEDDAAAMKNRAPVVTIMGHVDHGKTSLLDAIRETKVAEGEAGGITQHIGAYQVTMPDGRSVTFLDTPGHEAFTALRARGAKVTDISVLVVAADDGVKPQTIEAIDHSRAAEVPIIVAINKIDKEGANPEKVRSELIQHDLNTYTNEIESVEVSAKQRTNLDELIETILLQADVLELKSNPDAEASGFVIESKLDPGRGPLATVLISRGTLSVGDVVVAGSSWGKVRAMNDFRGNRLKEAGPSVPVEIVGFDSVPGAGEFCMVVESERVAREQASKRAQRLRIEQLARRQRGLTLDDLFARIKEGEVQDLNIIVKADVQGSIAAIEQELSKVAHDEVKVQVIHSGVGGITGSDVMLAAASQAIILGFNVRPNREARESAEREGVDLRTYRVIYKLREDVEAALSGMLSPEEVEETIGEAEVRQIFRASRIGTIAGCYVTQGQIARNAQVRLVRDGTVVHEGTISSLKRFQDDAKEVAQGYECGIAIEGYNDLKEGDIIEAFIIKQVERDLRSELAGSASS